LRRWSRGEILPDEAAARARTNFTAKGQGHVLRLFNQLRAHIDLKDAPSGGDVGVVARVLALGYVLDLAEVVSIAQHRQIDIPILARVFRAGLCDKAALDPLLTAKAKELKGFEPELSKEDHQVFEEGLALAAKLRHPAPSTAAYLDLDSGAHVAAELRKLADPTMRAAYANPIRIQAGIRNAFGEHGYEVAA
ncbi:MAG TPA: hypothetical protein VEM95_03670, partial [Thermoplasmata archaeon]|nr:hypothetical protein [Thermoplasmata archaeon]